MHCHQQAPEYQLFATLSLPGSTMHILSVGFHETNIIFIWHHSINRSIYKKMSVDLVFHLVLLFAPISHFPVYTSPNVLFSMYDMFTGLDTYFFLNLAVGQPSNNMDLSKIEIYLGMMIIFFLFR